MLTVSGVVVFMIASSFNADISSWAVDQGSDFYESELHGLQHRLCAHDVLTMNSPSTVSEGFLNV